MVAAFPNKNADERLASLTVKSISIHSSIGRVDRNMVAALLTENADDIIVN